MPAAVLKGGATMDRKLISISSKRQLTIPQKFYELLGFDREAECLVRGSELIIRPVKQNAGGEFAEQILSDLIAQGYNGDELLAQFKIMQKKIRPAIEAMLGDAEAAAHGAGEFYTYEDIFNPEE
ncbi:MAG: hypothetical protein ACOX4P_02800 [Anaerovoracaceae bacterium]|jgi:bifunctional DNA-binding transcriptional regulator/antitoxin component of YhaV-PrlF toxin-antitoxin module